MFEEILQTRLRTWNEPLHPVHCWDSQNWPCLFPLGGGGPCHWHSLDHLYLCCREPQGLLDNDSLLLVIDAPDCRPKIHKNTKSCAYNTTLFILQACFQPPQQSKCAHCNTPPRNQFQKVRLRNKRVWRTRSGRNRCFRCNSCDPLCLGCCWRDMQATTPFQDSRCRLGT
jgi:hypothetical protein